MGARAIPESTAPIARPSGGVPSLGPGIGGALQQAGGGLQQLGAQIARADARINDARMRAQANAEALTLRGQLLEAADRINTTADPTNAEDQFVADAAQISQAFTDRGLPASITNDALADFNAFAQTQRFKVRATARKRNVDLGRAATFDGLDKATQQFATAETELDQKTARGAYDTQLVLAAEGRFFSEEALEKLEQSSEIDLQTARVAHLINTGRARTALDQLNSGTIDLPSEERLRERVRASQAVEQEHTNSNAALKKEREDNHINFIEELAFAHLTGTPVSFSAADIRDAEMSAGQTQEVFKGFNNTTALFGSRDRVSDANTVAELFERASRNVLTRGDVNERRLELGAGDYNLLLREATAIAESGGVAQEFDARLGMNQIRAAYGIIGDQPIISILRPEEILNLNRDISEYVIEINTARRENRDVDEFALADRIAQRAVNRVSIPKIRRALREFDLPPANEWTFELLDSDVRMRIENAQAGGRIDPNAYNRALDSLSQALAIMQFQQEFPQ